MIDDKNILLQHFYATKFKIQIKVNVQKTIGNFRKLSYDSGDLTVTKENETVAPNGNAQTQGTKSCTLMHKILACLSLLECRVGMKSGAAKYRRRCEFRAE